MDSNGPRPPEFMRGYRNTKQSQYMNLGFGATPYPGKIGVGDYGPTQSAGKYYTPWNPTYPYPMDNTPGEFAQDIPLRNRTNSSTMSKGCCGKK